MGGKGVTKGREKKKGNIVEERDLSAFERGSPNSVFSNIFNNHCTMGQNWKKHRKNNLIIHNNTEKII